MKRSNSAAELSGITGIPDNILIGKEGEVIGRKISLENLTKKLEELFPNTK